MSLYNFIPTPIEGCFLVEPKILNDSRGKFVKLYHKESFFKAGLCDSYEEEYCSVSTKGVLRGLHFQIPPDAHVKLVSCLAGSILDVVVDLRRTSRTYKQYNTVVLDSKKNHLLYVPEGLAHGFYVLSEECIFLSLNSKKYSEKCDAGIKWNSINFDWPDDHPVVSEKDQNMPSLNVFNSPFL
jgi:dTDP-4-dehydrorhamnose 3,5-epimerase